MRVISTYLRAGNLPKNVTKVINEMPRTMSAIVVNVPILRVSLSTTASSEDDGTAYET
jgi:hypothetical protein